MKYTEQNKPLVCMQTNSTCYKQTRKMNIVGVLWHSTGANNPTLRRYVQPLESDANYSQMISLIGKNKGYTDYNHHGYESGLNAWIGKMADGSVSTIQTMPWDFRPWGCGGGRKGSCNTGWIQFEICEDSLNDPEYAHQVYKEACELTAYLCKKFNIDPNGKVYVKGTYIPTVLCHADSYRYGFGTNHGDVLHWLPRYGFNMDTVRQDVTALLQNQDIEQNIEKDDEDMTQERFNELMNNWLVSQADKNPSAWSNEARIWAESNGLVQGDEKGRKMYKKLLTREELVQVLYRALQGK